MTEGWGDKGTNVGSVGSVGSVGGSFMQQPALIKLLVNFDFDYELRINSLQIASSSTNISSDKQQKEDHPKCFGFKSLYV